MSNTPTVTVDVLNKLAEMSNSLHSRGVPGNPFNLTWSPGQQADAIHDALSRASIDADMSSKATDGTVGDCASLLEGSAVCAGVERAMQGAHKSRIRNMAHTRSRYGGHGSANGILKFGIPEMIARPE